MTTSQICQIGCDVAGRSESPEEYLDEMQQIVKGRTILDVNLLSEAVAAGWNIYGGFPKLHRQNPVPIREAEVLK